VNKLALQLEAAGLVKYSPLQAITFCFALATLTASWVQLSFEVTGLSAASFLAVIGLLFESLNLRAKQRSDELSKLWPEVIESLQSAASSGIGLVDSLSELSESGPRQIRSQFAGLVSRIDSGRNIDGALSWLKSQFGQLHADRLIELIRLVQLSGGAGYIDSLRDQAQKTRVEIATWGELESKQGWVTGTAKLALVAPWIIVAFLSARPENVAIYNTNQGITILCVGLLVSVFAYRLIVILGYLARPQRVFTR
jgi:tight adherence protein B